MVMIVDPFLVNSHAI